MPLSNFLLFVISFPFLGSIILFFPYFHNFSKFISFIVALFTFILSVFFFLFFDSSTGNFQFLANISCFNFFNYFFNFGIDGISLFFILLTTFLVPLCFLFFWGSTVEGNQPSFNFNFYCSLFLFIEGCILVVFSTLDLFVFYIFFEAVLIPIFLIMGIYGSRDRKIRAGFLFFLYTLFGSLFMLFGILLIYLEVGSTDYLLLLERKFSFTKQCWLWFAFFCSFAIKVPVLPFHIWLPEAHVEAPTGGSVILAAILLKLGSYGFIRFSLPLFPLASFFFKPFIFFLGTLGVVYSSISALRQTDIKRVVAYSSVAHVNLTLVGLFSFNLISVEGSIFQILSHGFVSAGLFFIVGCLYSRFHSRLILYFSGLAQTIPFFIFIFIFFTMANIALPGTSSFIGEFLILAGLFQINPFVCFFCATSLISGGCYALWLFNRVAFGNFKLQYFSFCRDLLGFEVFTFLPLIFFTLILGLFPNVFFSLFHCSCSNLIKFIFL